MWGEKTPRNAARSVFSQRKANIYFCVDYLYIIHQYDTRSESKYSVLYRGGHACERCGAERGGLCRAAGGRNIGQCAVVRRTDNDLRGERVRGKYIRHRQIQRD